MHSGNLLDSIWGALTGPGLSFDFMIFRSPALGACCCVLPTREGRAAVWIHPDHSCSACRFMGVVRCALCQVSVPATTWTGSSASRMHPFMTPGHASDPLPDGHAPQPRVVPQAPQTDIPHVPEPGAPSTSARLTVEEPRHAMEVCHGIAERLERHLSLGVVTPGSSTHEVIEECLRMARSVTQDHLVYVRSRRRQRTDQA
ncbi:hypothetical protein GmHk_01G001643 [Glycine max]|nr:hypothetical protein GmHk_01G001643 [Glycine max]